ncbi:Uncharacterised protein [Acholeplasma oculi]|uniref:Uncharacterized protein n=1 Tax=Acholeplasma oculi TaxID=35623 RepID=A0A061A9R9_9MOLU|nr:hypothetical protein [Acholeplasma oculi]CDR30650.1 hypothetical protein Aocu_05770 [Acholeplasma oculi]SKC34598.1 hypothetical protein SAMN02745122_0003 [Acholeplasma oculi]SKC45756.1 hypothetical protein SAMN02745122_1172 [Acholeplasma oculi]SUT89404.1 Uncharacterised protein [Acholeplasma oculi]
MIGEVLLEVIVRYPKLLLEPEMKNITFLLKELIIMEIVCLEGDQISSKEIQDVYEDLISNVEIPIELMEESKSAKGKSKLKVLLNNILSSNLSNSNSLMNRKEIKVEKVESKYFFSASSEIMKDIDELFKNDDEIVDMFKMGVFLEKYKYIPLLLKFLNIKTDYCQHNSNHIHRKAIFPVFKNIKDKTRSSIVNILFICDKCIVNLVESTVYKFEERGY